MDRFRSRRGARRLRGYARTIAVGIVSLSLAGGATFAFAGAAESARADETPFANGNAVAQAAVMRIAPGVGSLGLATTTGTSLAQVRNKLAEAKAQAVDLGLIGSSLTAEACDGSPGALRPDQLPQPVVVDNRNGAASASKDESPIAGSALAGGRKEASADNTPSSHADVTNVVGSVGKTVTLSGGRSDAEARVDPGKAREADATVSVDLDIAGVVQLHNAQWHAFHRTGEGAKQEGTFSVASTVAGGVPLPTDQLAPLQDAINNALTTSGITVQLPVVQHITQPNDFVQVTPLRIELSDTPAGKAVLGPALNASRAQREQIFNQIAAVACQLSGGLLVADIGVDIVSGTGFMIIDIGGASASSGQVDYQNPFGTIAPFTAVEAAPFANAGTATGSSAAGASSGATPATTATKPTSIAQIGPLATICETISPAKRPGCSRGMGVPLALLAVGLTSGVAYLDWRHQRRLRATDAEAVA